MFHLGWYDAQVWPQYVYRRVAFAAKKLEWVGRNFCIHVRKVFMNGEKLFCPKHFQPFFDFLSYIIIFIQFSPKEVKLLLPSQYAAQ